MGLLQPSFLDDKEKKISDEREEESFEGFNEEHNNEELDEELMEHGEEEITPVEHLLEPLDEDDGPVKCPMLDSFPLLEVVTNGLQKRKDPFAEREEHVTQSSSKRRHHHSPPPHTNFFQVFNQCRHYSF